MHGLGICVKTNSYYIHMAYEWSFRCNTPIPISLKINKYYLSLDIYTTLFVRENVHLEESTANTG